jgi:hypothetical protein
VLGITLRHFCNDRNCSGLVRHGLNLFFVLFYLGFMIRESKRSGLNCGLTGLLLLCYFELAHRPWRQVRKQGRGMGPALLGLQQGGEARRVRTPRQSFDDHWPFRGSTSRRSSVANSRHLRLGRSRLPCRVGISTLSPDPHEPPYCI